MRADLVDRLRGACDGHPYAKIEWPHRILHEAADEIGKLREELTATRAERDRAQKTCEQLIDKLSDNAFS